MIGLCVLRLLCVLGVPQDAAEEISLSWSRPADRAAEYQVLETVGGKPVARRDLAFIVYPADLTADGGNNIIINSYHDLALHFMFQLPKGKVKPGARWTVEKDLFEEARLALTSMHSFRPVAVRGVLAFRKVEKVNDVVCARIDGIFQLFEIRIDSQNNKRTIARNESGRLTTVSWISVTDSLLVKGAFEYRGKAQEFDGIKQGEEPKSSKLDLAQTIELKQDPLKLDPAAHVDDIHGAIRKGVQGLLKMQRKDGSWQDSSGSFAREFSPGVAGLCLMALVHSGARPDDPAIRAGFAWLQKAPFRKTYDVSAAIMAVETKYLPLEKYEDIATLTEAEARESIAKAISKEDQAYLKRAVDWLLMNQTKEGTWGYPEMSDQMDHSNTQYAALALKSASRCGVRIPSEVWKRIATHWLGTQRTVARKVPLKIEWFNPAEAGIDGAGTRTEEEFTQGPWGYFVKRLDPGLNIVTDEGYGSMTCAGLTSLIIAQSELAAGQNLDEALRKRIELSKKQGLCWIQERFTVRGCPPSAGFWSVFHTYWLYSLERVGVLYGIRKIAGHDWYLEGALMLVRQQRDDGSWFSYDQIPEVDTAFALLFLKKATLKVATK